MARLKNGLVITHITGKLGGGVFSKPSGVQHVYNKRGLTHKTTTNRIGLKRAFATASRLFFELTEATLFHWKTFADSLVFTNKVGNTYTPSVRTVFLKYIVNRVYYNLPIPPIPVRTYISNSINCTFYASASGLGQILLLLDSTLPSHYIVIEASPLRAASPGGKVRRTSFIFSSSISVDQYFDLSALYTSIYGSLSSPASIHFKVTLYSSSSLSSKIIFEDDIIVSSAALYVFDILPLPFAAYSLRQLVSSYTGPAIQVYTTNPAILTDVYFINGFVDTDAIIALSSGSPVYVRRWYNQAQAGYILGDVAQTNYPLIYSGSSFYYQNGYICVVSLGQADSFQTSNFAYTIGQKTISLVAFSSALSSWIGGWSASTVGARIQSLPSIVPYQQGPFFPNTQTISKLTLMYYLTTTTGTNWKFYLNLNSYTNPTTNIGTSQGLFLNLFARPNNTIKQQVRVAEFIFYNADQSSNRPLLSFLTNLFYKLY